MNYKEYGSGNRETLILLHGGGLSWWSYREAAELLAKHFHVLLPILDGHAGSDRRFTSIEDNAAELIQLTDERFGGKVKLIGGLSLGAQILLEMLSQRGDICEAALVESAAAVPSKLTAAMLPASVKASYGLIKKQWFARAQFRALKMKESLFDDYYRDTCLMTCEDMTAILTANQLYTLKDSLKDTRARVYVFAGSRETGQIKRSAKLIHNTVPDSRLEMLEGLYHGEFSINHADRFAAKVADICY